MALRSKISRVYQLFLKKRFAGKLRLLKDCHIGHRCFVIGNGPSLTVEDLNKLHEEYTFACNRIYKLFAKTDWRPTYYISQDDAVILENKDELFRIIQACKNCFLNGGLYRNYPRKVRKSKNVIFFKSYTLVNDDNKSPIEEDITKGINNGFTVTFAMIQIAIYMGFKEIYLLGVDNNFSKIISKTGEVIEQDIKNHFEGGDHPDIKDYGTNVWLLEQSYQSAKDYAKAHGIKIYNATRGGKLEVFERVDLDKVLRS